MKKVNDCKEPRGYLYFKDNPLYILHWGSVQTDSAINMDEINIYFCQFERHE